MTECLQSFNFICLNELRIDLAEWLMPESHIVFINFINYLFHEPFPASSFLSCSNDFPASLLLQQQSIHSRHFHFIKFVHSAFTKFDSWLIHPFNKILSIVFGVGYLSNTFTFYHNSKYIDIFIPHLISNYRMDWLHLV